MKLWQSLALGGTIALGGPTVLWYGSEKHWFVRSPSHTDEQSINHSLPDSGHDADEPSDSDTSKSLIESAPAAETEPVPQALPYPILNDAVTDTVTFNLPGKDGPTPISVAVYSREGPSDLTYLRLHGNEESAASAAQAAIDEMGGRLLAIEGGGKNLSFVYEGTGYNFDPNRIWTDSEVNTSFGTGPQSARGYVLGFRDTFVRQFSLGELETLVAVHNNTDGDWDVRSFDGQPAYSVNIATDRDPDNFFLTTDESLFDALVLANYNVVHHGTGVVDDGSLSVYAAKNGLRYVNVEAQVGETAVQTAMVTALRDLLLSDAATK